MYNGIGSEFTHTGTGSVYYLFLLSYEIWILNYLFLITSGAGIKFVTQKVTIWRSNAQALLLLSWKVCPLDRSFKTFSSKYYR
jgi:hypothetical protein